MNLKYICVHAARLGATRRSELERSTIESKAKHNVAKLDSSPHKELKGEVDFRELCP